MPDNQDQAQEHAALLDGPPPDEVVAEVVAEPEKLEQPDEPKAEEKKDAPSASAIPQARLNEVIRERKIAEERAAALEARAAELEAENAALKKPKQPEPVKSDSIDKMEADYIELVLNAEQEKALALRQKINAAIVADMTGATTAAIRAEIEKNTRELEERERNAAIKADEPAFNKAIAEATAAFPFLDANSPDANQSAIDDVVALRDYYRSKGETLSSALIKAVNKVAPDYLPAKATVTPMVDPRKAVAIKRNAEANAQQPVQLVAGVGNRSAPQLVVPATQEAYEKLPEEERARLLA